MQGLNHLVTTHRIVKEQPEEQERHASLHKRHNGFFKIHLRKVFSIL